MDEKEELTYVQKISNVLGIPVLYVQKMRDTGCMNEISTRNILIKADYMRLKKQKMTVKKIMKELREIYNIEMRQLQSIVHAHRRVYYCKYCGKQITLNSVVNHDGVCPQCIINRIKL